MTEKNSRNGSADPSPSQNETNADFNPQFLFINILFLYLYSYFNFYYWYFLPTITPPIFLLYIILRNLGFNLIYFMLQYYD